MLTARGTELERVVGLELGADDYVVKPFSGAEVIARMRAVLRRVEAGDGSCPDVVGRAAAGRAGRPARVPGRRGAGAVAQGVRPAGRAGAHAGEVVTREDLIARVWDENWFGSTKTLGRARRVAAREARRRRVRAALPAHRARRRLPLHGPVGVGVLTLRARLVLGAGVRARAGDRVDARAAGAQSVRDRIEAEVAQAGVSQAEVVAATAAAAATSAGWLVTSAREVRGRVMIVDARGVVLADSSPGGVGADYSSRPEIAAALRGADRAGRSATRRRWTSAILATAVPIVARRAAGRRRADHPERRRRGPRRALGDARPGAGGPDRAGAGAGARAPCWRRSIVRPLRRLVVRGAARGRG